MQGGQWLTDNWTTLCKMSKKWHWTEWSELISLYVIYVEANWISKLQPMNENDRMRFTQTWLKNNSGWSNSGFNKSIRVNNLGDKPSDCDDDLDSQIADEVEEWTDDLIELNSEPIREDIKEWLIDLYRNFSEKEVNRLIKLRSIYLTLDTPNRVLWDLYFTQMLTMRQISSKLDLPLASIHNMITDLKKQIRIKC